MLLLAVEAKHLRERRSDPPERVSDYPLRFRCRYDRGDRLSKDVLEPSIRDLGPSVCLKCEVRDGPAKSSGCSVSKPVQYVHRGLSHLC